MNLQGNDIHLRALEVADINFLYQLENDQSLWHVSNTLTPFSRYALEQYIANSHLDIFEIKQLRLVIEHNKKPVGCIDLFDFDPQHHRAGVGIVIAKEYESRGFAFEALKIIVKFAFGLLQMHQLYANITVDNEKSINLFEKANFVKTGEKIDWVFTQGNYKNEYCYQLINKK